MIRPLIILLHAVLLLGANSFSQDPLTRLRLAQSFEQSSEWERAASMYEELHRIDPANYMYYDGLLRSWTQLKKYEQAIPLVEERIRLFPKDPMLLATLGGLFYDSGREREADSLWRITLTVDPSNTGLYRVVANEQLERRLLDRAIATYLAGRKAGRNEALFADELAGLYSAMQEYAKATREFIRVLAANPQQLSSIESRISSFTFRSEGIAGARAAVAEEIIHNPNDVSLRMLHAWLAMEAKDYDHAYKEYVEIDRLGRSNGQELFQFAQRVSAERSYLVAARAYRDVIAQSKNAGILPMARLGYARAVEELSLTDSLLSLPLTPEATETSVAETRPTAARALQLYEQLAAEGRYGEATAQARYRIGIIAFERLFDLDRAVQAFTQSRLSLPGSTTAAEATLKLADVHTVRNDLAAARNELQSLTLLPQMWYQDQARFRLAELDYFQGNFDGALDNLKLVTAQLGTDAANDALMLQYFILENKTAAPEGLNAFASADLLLRQRRHAEALANFERLATSFSGAPLVDDATLRIAELQHLLGRTNDALATFGRLVRDMPSSILKDKALFRIGEISEQTLHDNQKAIAAYEELLAKFPNSLFAEEARKRVRLLRNDHL